jgi:hypothetical protein
LASGNYYSKQSSPLFKVISNNFKEWAIKLKVSSLVGKTTEENSSQHGGILQPSGGLKLGNLNMDSIKLPNTVLFLSMASFQ